MGYCSTQESCLKANTLFHPKLSLTLPYKPSLREEAQSVQEPNLKGRDTDLPKKRI